MQQCPKCESKFSITKHRDYNDGEMKMSNYPTSGHATFCPDCGIKLDSWEAYIDRPVIVETPEGDEFEAVLKEVGNIGGQLMVLSEMTGKLMTVDMGNVYVQVAS